MLREDAALQGVTLFPGHRAHVERVVLEDGHVRRGRPTGRSSLAGLRRRLATIGAWRIVTWLVVVVLLVAAAYEAAIALGWVALGSQPGDEARGQAIVTIAALLGLAAGMGIGAAAVLGQGSVRRWPALLIPAAAAAYLASHYYAFDSYYLPTLRRFSDDGSIAASWIYAVAGCALAVAGVIALAPRTGLALLPFVLLACGIFVVGQGIGH